ncbi:MAG: hypothetical protein AAFZ65_05365 [Planctomycetota bacterium]
MTTPDHTLSPLASNPQRAIEQLRQALRSSDASRAELLAALRRVPAFARQMERLGAGLRRGGGTGGGLEAAVLFLGQSKLAERFELWVAPATPTPSARD